MDFGELLDELRKERDAIDVAIHSLERLVRDRLHGPGRPPLMHLNGHSNGTNHAAPLPLNDEQ
jgi:hypothetical protein